MTICVFFTSLAFASPKDKLFRGIENMLVFPAEIPKHAVREGMKAKSDILVAIYGGFYGIPKGATFAVSRAVSGVVDFLMFPFDLPREWKQAIPIERFTFEETPESISS